MLVPPVADEAVALVDGSLASWGAVELDEFWLTWGGINTDLRDCFIASSEKGQT